MVITKVNTHFSKQSD